MKISLKELTAITKGQLDITETARGFTFRRMTEAQLAAIDDIPRYRNRSRFCAGIRFDFWTDASRISFTYDIVSFDETRDFFGIDLYVNDVMVHTLHEKPIEHRTEVFQYALPTSDTLHHILIYLPYSANCAVRDFVLSDATQFVPAKPYDKTLLCYGDSITQGYDSLHPSLTYAAILARTLSMELLNQGISGYVFDPATIDSSHVPTPQLVLAAYGTNDWTNKPTLAQIKADVDAYLDKLVTSFPNSRLYLTLPIWRGDCMERFESGQFTEVVDVINTSALRHPAIHILNGNLAVPHHTDFYADGFLHPNDCGMLLYAQWAAAQILEK